MEIAIKNWVYNTNLVDEAVAEFGRIGSNFERRLRVDEIL
jgi:hypothetical protein